jgi:hypothetical protein
MTNTYSVTFEDLDGNTATVNTDQSTGLPAFITLDASSNSEDTLTI